MPARRNNWRRPAAWVLALVLALSLAPRRGRAVEEGVYLTAVNDVVLEMTAETMPFWSNGALYVSNQVFEGTDLGVSYVRNDTMGLAVLYTPRSDLRFHLEDQTTTDKQGYTYSVHAIERGGYVFFPLDMICRYFGLAWSLNDTDIVPLLRVTSGSAILDDRSFIDAASSSMRSRYTAYQRQMAEREETSVPQDDPSQTATGRQIRLLLTAQTAADALAAAEALEEGQTATFLLRLEQMEDGDLLRGLIAQGHAVALLAQGTTAPDVAAEVERARDLLWQGACAWLELVWYEGEADAGPLLADLGCGRVTAGLDRRRSSPLTSASRARSLVGVIGEYRGDLSVCLGDAGENLPGLPALAQTLEEDGYRVSAWRLEIS